MLLHYLGEAFNDFASKDLHCTITRLVAGTTRVCFLAHLRWPWLQLHECQKLHKLRITVEWKDICHNLSNIFQLQPILLGARGAPVAVTKQFRLVALRCRESIIFGVVGGQYFVVSSSFENSNNYLLFRIWILRHQYSVNRVDNWTQKVITAVRCWSTYETTLFKNNAVRFNKN